MIRRTLRTMAEALRRRRPDVIQALAARQRDEALRDGLIGCERIFRSAATSYLHSALDAANHAERERMLWQAGVCNARADAIAARLRGEDDSEALDAARRFERLAAGVSEVETAHA